MLLLCLCFVSFRTWCGRVLSTCGMPQQVLVETRSWKNISNWTSWGRAPTEPCSKVRAAVCQLRSMTANMPIGCVGCAVHRTVWFVGGGGWSWHFTAIFSSNWCLHVCLLQTSCVRPYFIILLEHPWHLVCIGPPRECPVFFVGQIRCPSVLLVTDARFHAPSAIVKGTHSSRCVARQF